MSVARVLLYTFAALRSLHTKLTVVSWRMGHTAGRRLTSHNEPAPGKFGSLCVAFSVKALHGLRAGIQAKSVPKLWPTES